MQDIDIYRTAKIMIDQHGDKALLEVVYKCDHLRAKNDQEGIAVWMRIADAIHWMQENPSAVNQKCH
jgi:hypothetical protein